MPRCSYIYDDATRCVFDDARLADGEMCGAHKIMARYRDRDVKRQTAKRAKVRASGTDASASWCTCKDRGQVGECEACGKPTYARYMTTRSQR